MFRYFFDIRTKEETKNLFKGLKIGNQKEIILRKAPIAVISESISTLMGYMNKHCGRKVINKIMNDTIVIAEVEDYNKNIWRFSLL